MGTRRVSLRAIAVTAACAGVLIGCGAGYAPWDGPGRAGFAGAPLRADGESTADPLEVTYRSMGTHDGVLILVERRPAAGREYLVLCSPDRTPPCVRTQLATMGTGALARWQRSGDVATPSDTPIPEPPRSYTEALATRSPTPTPRPAYCRGASCGQLRLAVNPWCVLEIDGAVIGHTPILDQWLPAGSHIARCHNPESGRVEEFGVDIRPSRRTTLNLGLGLARAD